jgi:hypothetical protein
MPRHALVAHKSTLVAAQRLPHRQQSAYEPATQRALINADMAAALKQVTPATFVRKYVAWWETRNLRMVAVDAEAILK